MRRLQATIVIAAAALALAACGSSDTSDEVDTSAQAASTPSASPSADAADAPDAAEVPEQLDFSSTTTTGASFEGASLAGQPAVVWFWAPWCHVCQGEAPQVSAAADATDVQFLGVAALDSAASMQGFVENYDLDFTNLADTEAAVWARFGVTSQPAYAFISAAGEVDVVAGSLSAEELDSKIAELEKG